MESHGGRLKEIRTYDEGQLRARAEEAIGMEAVPASILPEEIPKLLHELRVHHVELEMQNQELRLAQNRLAESCDHYTQLYDFSPAGYVTLTRGGIIEEANLRFCSLIGVHRKAVLHQPLRAFVLPQDWGILDRHLADIAALCTTQTCKLRLLPEDGEPVMAQLECMGVQNSEADKHHMQMAILDITQRERAESLVRDSQRQVQEAAAKLLTAREEERRRIARNLHDDHCQRVAAMILDLGLLLKRHPGSWADPIRQLQPMKVALQALLAELRDLSHDLHPGQTVCVAFDEALQSYLADFTEKTQIPTTLHAAPRAMTLPPAISTCLYRIAQEGLTNIRKHAMAKQISVSVQSLPGAVELLIKDDGRGFDPERVQGTHHLGLTSVRERAEQMNGTLTITSRSGCGTTLLVRIPLLQAGAPAL
jgi:PAS domain S-box-containing protein